MQQVPADLALNQNVPARLVRVNIKRHTSRRRERKNKRYTAQNVSWGYKRAPNKVLSPLEPRNCRRSCPQSSSTYLKRRKRTQLFIPIRLTPSTIVRL